ncbi:hypothetical protein QTP86_019614 [Hemibagrus guttatus]|nr:hypothetical protein QTP86_019614 [Hemibagrus guttatus]
MPINLPCMSLDWGRKLEYPEETPEARGEHANSTHTAEVGIKPLTLEEKKKKKKKKKKEKNKNKNKKNKKNKNKNKNNKNKNNKQEEQ